MRQLYHDGGRAAAGYKGDVGDCVVRAIAIVTGKPYREVYKELAKRMREWATTSKSKRAKWWRLKRRFTPRNGTPNPVMKRYMTELGFEWTPTMGIGTGCTVHLKANELPSGRIVARLTKHTTAIVNGVIYDTHDPSRNETRCVYGYWTWKGDQ